MAHGAPRSPILPPHPDLEVARDCEHCLGWGTVVTRDGDHQLCHTCQQASGHDQSTARPRF